MQLNSLVKITVLAAAILGLSNMTIAQLAAPNAAGVSAGHTHLAVPDLAKAREIWKSFGGVEKASGRIQMLQFPGIDILFAERAPGLPSGQTSANHIGFSVNNYADYKAKLDAVGATYVLDNAETGQILADFPEGLDAIITGVGTGGHITGVAEVLKKAWPALKVYAVEPTLSPVISGGQPGPHPIQGIGAGFIPANLHTQLLDGVIQVDPTDAKDYARRAATQEGLLVGISSGGTLAAIAQKLKELPAGSRVLGFNYDTGERYLSVPDFLPE